MTLHLSRRAPRRVLTAALGLSLAVGLAACSSDDDSGNSASGTSSASTGSTDSTTAPEGYYPHTQATLYGNVDIKNAPERIIAMTPSIADQMLALGVTPTAVAYDPKKIDSDYPWISDKIKDISNGSLLPNNEVNIEEIAKLEPDLIIGEKWIFKDKGTWEKAESTAPTIIPDSSAGNVGWEQSLKTTAAALGLQQKADEVIGSLKSDYEKVGSEIHTGKTYNFIAYNGEKFWPGNGSVFKMFNIEPEKSQDDAQGAGQFSMENMKDLQSDLLIVWPTSDESKRKLQNEPIFQSLPAAKSGDVYYANNADANAINNGGILSLHWFLDRITPTIKKLK